MFVQQVGAMDGPEEDTPFTLDTNVAGNETKGSSSAILSVDNESIARDRERLRRFHEEAMSFLRKAYSNDDAVLVEDCFDKVVSRKHSSEDFLAKRRVELDKIRLERFHAQAVSFLDRAYADEPNTIVVEETLSPGMISAGSQDKEMLQKFHEETMILLDAVAGGAPLEDVDETMKGRCGRPGADRTSLQIERDKARLEQHYQDAMSFLERADAEKKGVLVEEQELESAIVDRLQLQRYAQDAMSFLDKAFRNDASVMVYDGEDTLPAEDGQESVEKDATGFGRRSDVNTSENPHSSLELVRTRASLDESSSYMASSQKDEDWQIAEDRLALERYDAEVGDFLSKAYLDDSSVIVEDADSETSGADRGLYARRVAPSDTSVDDRSASPDDFSENAYSGDDDGSQDPPLRENSRLGSLRSSPPLEPVGVVLSKPSSSGNVASGECSGILRSGVTESVCDAMDCPDSMGVMVLGENDHGLCSQQLQSTARSHFGTPTPDTVKGPSDGHEKAMYDCFVEAGGHDEETSADRHCDALSIGFRQEDRASGDAGSCSDHFVIPSTVLDGVETPTGGSSSRAVQGSPLSETEDLLVDVILEDNAGHTREWSDVPLQKSFYRQVPRGSTIKIRPRVSPQVSISMATEPHWTTQKVGHKSLHRVEKERNVLISALEELVNERSVLAAEVREMKTMIHSVDGCQSDEGRDVEDDSDIDLASELRGAHATMSKLIEEMDLTLRVLDIRHQETLERAHKAEERCIRLETNASNLQIEFSKQGIQLSQIIAEERRLTSLLAKCENGVDALVNKYEEELKALQGDHREEPDRSVNRSHELINEVLTLQKRVKSGGTSTSAQKLQSWSRSLQGETGMLKLQLADNDRTVTQERSTCMEPLGDQQAKLERASEPDDLSGSVKGPGFEAQKGESANRNLERNKDEATRMDNRVKELERTVGELRQQLTEARRQRVAAEAEAGHVHSRYKEIMKNGISQVRQNTEMFELETALKHLKDEAGAREQKLRRQLSDFQVRTKQAEASASRAELGAKEAAEVARTAQERSLIAIDSERRAREAVEAEKHTVVLESKAWEKFAQQQMYLNTETENCGGALAKSSSRRGMRKSPSKQGGSSKKKKDGANGSGSEKTMSGSSAGEDTMKKKGSLRPRLFR